MKLKVPDFLVSAGRRIAEKSPEIMMVSGIVLAGAAVVTACKATLKAKPKMDALKERRKEIQNNPEVPEEKKNELVAKEKVKTVTSVCKDYLLPTGLFVGSAALNWGSNRMLRGRLFAATTAYAALFKSFAEYRRRNIEDNGADKDREYMYGARLTTAFEQDEDGNVTEKKICEQVAEPISRYARWFDQGEWDSESKQWVHQNSNWSPYPGQNFMFLKRTQIDFNRKLQTSEDGLVFLNEVYKALGLPKSYEGQFVGWSRDGGDGYIDFGIFNEKTRVPQNEAFVDGKTTDALLDFNVEGDITMKLKKTFGTSMAMKLIRSHEREFERQVDE